MTSSTALTPYAVCSGDAAPRDAPYELGTAPPARRAVAERLPPEVATAAAEFIVGPLRSDPRRVGKPLGEELAGIHSARLGREWRVLYEIDEARGRRARHPAPLERLPPAMTVATGTAG